MTTDPPEEPAYSRWTWPTGPEDVPTGPSGPDVLSPAARKWGWFISGSGLAVALAALLPWATAGPLHANGTAGDGILTLVFGAVSVVAGLGRALATRQGRWQTTWPIVAATMGAFVLVISYTDVQSVAQRATVGVGLIVTLVAGAGLAGASVMALLRRT